MTEIATLDSKLDGDSRTLKFGEWECASAEPGSINHPMDLPAELDYRATVPGTVAAILNAAGKWSFEHPPEIDALDWWYRTTFRKPDSTDVLSHIAFEGLASLAEVWLNGKLVLSSKNMFRRQLVDLDQHPRPRPPGDQCRDPRAA